MYFANFPNITYDFTAKTDASPIIGTLPDTTTAIRMTISDSDFSNLTTRYTIVGSELPEHVSQKWYKTPDLDWTIRFINDICDLSNEWPLPDIDLMNYVVAKYGSANVNNIHHYEKIPEGIVMDQTFINTTYGSQYANPVTNFDYETRINDQKRYIYVIKVEYINDFVQQYMAQLT